MTTRLATRFVIAMLACVLVPGLCEAASVFTAAPGTAMSNGSQLRLVFHANTFGVNGMPGVDDVVKTVNLTPTAQYNYMGSYYFAYNWNSTVVSNGTSYAYSKGVVVECLLNGEWVHYTNLSSTMTSVP